MAMRRNEKDSAIDLIEEQLFYFMTWACHETACTFCHAVMLSLMLGN